MREETNRERVGRLASRQHGRVSSAQLQLLGINYCNIGRWQTDGYLVRVLPRVYAVGHLAPSREAELWGAVLYAGPNAMLSHVTAAHFWGLLDYPARAIEVSTPRQAVRSVPGRIKVYERRCRERVIHDGLPTTSIAEMVYDVATTASFEAVRRLLSQLDYHHMLDLGAIEAADVRGRRGSERVRQALAIHQPGLAHTNEELELLFFTFCERYQLPLPRCNVKIHDITVDAYWPRHNLVIELDGGDNHASVGQRRRDHTNDFTLRGHGLTVIRYDWDQVTKTPDVIYRELARLLTEAA